MRHSSMVKAATACVAMAMLGSAASAAVIDFRATAGMTGPLLNLKQTYTGAVPEFAADPNGPVTITAYTATGSTMRNNTAEFGIDGPSDSDNRAFETLAGGNEWMTFSFDRAVTITEFNFVGLTGNTTADTEKAEITIGTPVPTVLTVLGLNVKNTAGQYNPPGGSIIVPANTLITLTATAGKWNLETITATVNPIPEPASLGLVAAGSMLVLSRRGLISKS